MADILITGASGFTGAALTERLSAEGGHRLFGVARRPALNPSLFTEVLLSDLEEPESAAKILKRIRPEWIFHLAGRLSGTLSELMQTNFAATIHLLGAASRMAPGARILLIGSAAEYGKPADGAPIPETQMCLPETPYGLSKYAMTLLGLRAAAESGLRINIARAFNIIGPGCPRTLLLGALIERVQKARALGESTVAVGDVRAERDFIDVRDAAEAYMAIIKSEANGEIFNVCTGVPVKIQTVVELALAAFGKEFRFEVEPSLGSPGAPRVFGSPKKIGSLGFGPHFSLEESITDVCRAAKS